MVLLYQSTALFIFYPTECYKEQIKIMSINCVIIYLIHDIDLCFFTMRKEDSYLMFDYEIIQYFHMDRRN